MRRRYLVNSIYTAALRKAAAAAITVLGGKAESITFESYMDEQEAHMLEFRRMVIQCEIDLPERTREDHTAIYQIALFNYLKEQGEIT